MQDRSILRKVFFAGTFVFIFGGLFFIKASPSRAATNPTFLMTWKASNSYIPSFYAGKALPSYGSKVTASLELIANGKTINISGQTIYWYLNGTLVGGGVGIQQVTFTPFGEPPSSLTLSVELPQYNGHYLAHEISLPFSNPVAIVYAPYPKDVFSTNPVAVSALPFFFDTSSATDLSFSWAVNGQSGTNTENPQEAEVTLPQGTQNGTALDISLTIKNSVGSTIATANQNLTYQSQL